MCVYSGQGVCEGEGSGDGVCVWGGGGVIGRNGVSEGEGDEK